MQIEYIIYGKSNKNPKYEDILLSEIQTLELAQKLESILINKYGCFDTRIHKFDWNKPMDITQEFVKSINI
jgi:hypothetical protein